MQQCTTAFFVLPLVIFLINLEDSGGLLEIPGHQRMVGVFLDKMLIDGVGGGQEVGSS